MTNEQRQKCRAALRELCDATEATKSADYSKVEDVLSNFKEMANFTGTTKYQAWLVYFGKHMTTIINSIRKSPEFPQVESEPIKGRIVDAIVYLQILDCLIEEDIADKKPKGGRPRKVAPVDPTIQENTQEITQGRNGDPTLVTAGGELVNQPE